MSGKPSTLGVKRNTYKSSSPFPLGRLELRKPKSNPLFRVKEKLSFDPLKEIDSFSYVINSKYGKSNPVKVILERSFISTGKLPENLQKTFLPIYYNYNDSELLLNYKNRVDAVALAMNQNPQLVVEVSSYSDCRGKREYNLCLLYTSDAADE